MDKFPVEVNEASYRELLRVPGVGKLSARRIVELRKRGVSFSRLQELKELGVVVNRAEPFIKLQKSYQATLGF